VGVAGLAAGFAFVIATDGGDFGGNFPAMALGVGVVGFDGRLEGLALVIAADVGVFGVDLPAMVLGVGNVGVDGRLAGLALVIAADMGVFGGGCLAFVLGTGVLGPAVAGNATSPRIRASVSWAMRSRSPLSFASFLVSSGSILGLVVTVVAVFFAIGAGAGAGLIAGAAGLAEVGSAASPRIRAKVSRAMRTLSNLTFASSVSIFGFLVEVVSAVCFMGVLRMEVLGVEVAGSVVAGEAISPRILANVSWAIRSRSSLIFACFLASSALIFGLVGVELEGIFLHYHQLAQSYSNANKLNI